jgi:beta-galactosidase/beta-glucuronidase
MRIKTDIKKIWNGFFIITALICLIVFYLSYNHKKIINNAGIYTIDKYVGIHKNQYDLTIKELKTGSLDSTIDVLNKWEGFKKGDRIYPFKRDLMLNLSLELYKLKKYNDLAVLAKKWQVLDKRDVTAMTFYYEALRNIEKKHEEGVVGLINTYEKFPKNTYLKKFYRAAMSGET